MYLCSSYKNSITILHGGGKEVNYFVADCRSVIGTLTGDETKPAAAVQFLIIFSTWKQNILRVFLVLFSLL